MTMRQLSPEDASQWMRELGLLLCDAVDSGASIGFLPPVPEAEADEYWSSVFAAVATGNRILLAAFEEDGRLIGTVQLGLETRANGNHRAEVMKLMVHRDARRKGAGRALMMQAESVARDLGRTLLVLDTRRRDAAERLYLQLGYTAAGIIPGYARSSSGVLCDTVFMYKQLRD